MVGIPPAVTKQITGPMKDPHYTLLRTSHNMFGNGLHLFI